MKRLYLMCVLCRRMKFSNKSAHRCNHGYRKRRIIWVEVFETCEERAGGKDGK